MVSPSPDFEVAFFEGAPFFGGRQMISTSGFAVTFEQFVGGLVVSRFSFSLHSLYGSLNIICQLQGCLFALQSWMGYYITTQFTRNGEAVYRPIDLKLYLLLLKLGLLLRLVLYCLPFDSRPTWCRIRSLTLHFLVVNGDNIKHYLSATQNIS